MTLVQEYLDSLEIYLTYRFLVIYYRKFGLVIYDKLLSKKANYFAIEDKLVDLMELFCQTMMNSIR